MINSSSFSEGLLKILSQQVNEKTLAKMHSDLTRCANGRSPNHGTVIRSLKIEKLWPILFGDSKNFEKTIASPVAESSQRPLRNGCEHFIYFKFLYILATYIAYTVGWNLKKCNFLFQSTCACLCDIILNTSFYLLILSVGIPTINYT